MEKAPSRTPSDPPANRPCEIIDIGLCSYAKAYELQKKLASAKAAGSAGDSLVLVEHFPVLTLGRRGRREHICVSIEQLRSLGIEVIDIDRGGDITYHGPGQLVGYPIMDLRVHRQDVNWILRSLEQSLVSALGRFGVAAGVAPGLTGVWVNGAKIAAIGIGISHWITYHGFALNVDPEMDHFKLIIPCGLQHKRVTCMREVLGQAPPMEQVKKAVIESFCETFGLTSVTLDFTGSNG